MVEYYIDIIDVRLAIVRMLEDCHLEFYS